MDGLKPSISLRWSQLVSAWAWIKNGGLKIKLPFGN
jgi:hypothetical protein